MAKRLVAVQKSEQKPEAIDPGHRWDRPIQAPGHTQVDFEERVDFRRLHAYRLGRVRQALAGSGLGALLVFDQHNIRYISGTVIGEWARDKLIRYGLLTGNGEPWVWDFGSAARHHRLYTPWLPANQCLAGMVGMRGAVSAKAGLFEQAAREIADILAREGVAGMPIGIDVVEPPFLFALQKLGVEVRDGQQVMLEARVIKNADELVLLNMAAAMGDGVYQDIFEALKPGVRENEIVALANKRLYEMGSDCVEAINAISGERCSPHPHNFTDRLIRPGDQAFFDIIQSFVGYRTCYYRTFSVGRATPPQVTAYKRAREWMDSAIELDQARRGHGPDRPLLPQGAGHRLRERDGRLRAQLLPRPGSGAPRAADHLAAQLLRRAHGARGRHGLRGRDLLPGHRRDLRGTHRGGGDRDAEGRPDHHVVPGRRAAHRQSVLSTSMEAWTAPRLPPGTAARAGRANSEAPSSVSIRSWR